MRSTRGLRAWVAVAALALATAPPASANEEAAEPIDEAFLLDVGVQIFDPGVPTGKSKLELAKEGIFPKIREAESRYIAIQLKETLQRSAEWGAVRVVPKSASSPLDVTVTGRILKSDGQKLELELWASDASGTQWLKKKKYKFKADAMAYDSMDEYEFEPREPFQSLYNQVARDLAQARRKLRPAQVTELRKLSDLRFAADIAPDAFSRHLKRGRRGKWEIDRLPAQSDPMMERVASIRERDYMLIDTLDEGYADFGWRMSSSYGEWRRFSYIELEAAAAVRKSAWKRILLGGAAIAGGVLLETKGGRTGDAGGDVAIIIGTTTILQGIDRHSQAKIHKEALAELSASFDAEIDPVLIEVDNRQVKLSGDAATQYQSWRELLREIFTTETGIAIDPNEELLPGTPEAAVQ